MTGSAAATFAKFVIGVALAALPLRPALAAVQVLTGPTPIPEGNAKAAADITLVNERLAFSLAVQTPVPYGVPRGAIVDLAPVIAGTIQRDRVVFADFIPNHWSAWPNTFQRIDIVERGPARGVVRTTRDWGKVTIVTQYTLDAQSDHIEIQTTMTNGGEAVLHDLLSGLTLWPNSGFLFPVPGMAGVGEGPAGGALAKRVLAYDEGWFIALHADYFDHVGDGSMDLYRRHDLAPGASRSFEGWLQVGPSGDLASMVDAEIERRHLKGGSLRGAVTDREGKPVDSPVIVVYKNALPYAWTMGRQGRYELRLPAGDYEVLATARNYSQTRKMRVAIAAGAGMRRDFRALDPPGSVRFAVTERGSGKALDARISIEKGQKPAVEFLGRTTFFTALDSQGRVELPIAPGRYQFDVDSGGGFLGTSVRVDAAVAAHRETVLDVRVTRLFEPAARGWFSADLHHHADQAEAVTPAADLARSELAAGLDLLFVSDHDSTFNHRALQSIAERRGVAFIPGIELSPSWGHFNAYPLELGAVLRIDTTVATVGEVIAEARRQGAIVVQVNHPFIPYGYLSSVAAGVAPGGFDPDFELLEINAAAPADDEKILHALWADWNAGHHYYLSAGTDTHDVWNSRSGSVRVFAHPEGPVSAAGFARALKAGHAYVSSGPLIFPSVVFGGELKLRPQQKFSLDFELQSVAGLKTLQLIAAGSVAARKVFFTGAQRAQETYQLTAEHSTWYSVVVEDERGGKAYSNPIWIDVVAAPP